LIFSQECDKQRQAEAKVKKVASPCDTSSRKATDSDTYYLLFLHSLKRKRPARSVIHSEEYQSAAPQHKNRDANTACMTTIYLCFIYGQDVCLHLTQIKRRAFLLLKCILRREREILESCPHSLSGLDQI